MKRWRICRCARQHYLTLRGSRSGARTSQTRPVKAIPEICAMAQSSSHTLFACLQMPDALSGLIQGIVHERVHRNCNWPIDPSRSAPGAESFNIESLPPSCPASMTGPASMTALSPTLASPLWLGKGSGSLGSGGHSCDANRIQWLQYTTFRGASCWMESLSAGPVPKPFVVAAGFNFTQPHLPNRPPTLGSSPQHALHPSHIRRILNGALHAPHACIRL